MGKALRTLFNLYPGEEKKAFLFVCLAFFWSSGSYGLLTLSGGLFVEHVGAKGLPQAYVSIALAMCVFSSFLVWSLPKFSLKRLLTGVLSLSLVFNTFFLIVLSSHFEPKPLWYVFKIINWIAPVVIYSSFWGFIDEYYDLQDGKRCFCLFNAIIFLGDALGAGLVSWLITSVGNTGMITLFLGLMLCSIPLIMLIHQQVEPLDEEHVRMIPKKHSSFKKLLRIVFTSPFTMLLLLFYLTMHLVAIVTEYHYISSFEAILQKKHELVRITEFLGQCNLWISLGNMLFGVIFYSRLVKRVGIHNTIVITPIVFLILYSVFGFWTSLACSVMAMVACEGFAYALDDNNLNLLLSGVSSKAKNQIRIAIDSFFEPVGMLISALLLYFFSEHHLKIGIGLSIGAVVLVFLLRASYHKAIFQNLLASTIRFEQKVSRWFLTFSGVEKKKIERFLLRHLKVANEKTQLLTFETLLQLKQRRTLPYLLDRFSKMSIPGKIAVIHLFEKSCFYNDSIILDTLKRLSKMVPHPTLKSAIGFYFASQNILSEMQGLDYLQHSNLELKGVGILSLCFSQKKALQNLAKDELKILFQSNEDPKISLALFIIGKQKNQSNISLLIPYLNHKNPAIIKKAAQSIELSSFVQEPKIADQLSLVFKEIEDIETRIFCLKSLQVLCDPIQILSLLRLNHKMHLNEWSLLESSVLKISLSIKSEAIEILQNSSFSLPARIIAGKSLSKSLSEKTFNKILSPILEQEFERALFYYYHAHVIQKQLPECTLWILEKALISKYEMIVDFIIQIIAVFGKINYPEVLLMSLKSPHKKIKAQALETIEKMCPSKILHKIHLLLNVQASEKKLALYLHEQRMPWNVWQILNHLEHSSFPEDRLIATTLKKQFNPNKKPQPLQSL